MLTDAQRAAKARYRERNREALREKNREYRQKNPEKVQESARRTREKNPDRDRDYYAKNRERILAQVSARYDAKMSTEEGREDVAAYHRTYRKRRICNDPMQHVRQRVAQARHRAKQQGVPCDLTWEWARENWTGKCALTGIPFVFVFADADRDQRVSPYSPSLDRIIPGGGYTKDNVRWVIHAVNMFKSDNSDEVMLSIAKALLEKSAA
jgi:hypothetical protein